MTVETYQMLSMPTTPFLSQCLKRTLQSTYTRTSAGDRYGMELHWDKFQLLPIQCAPVLTTPAGDPIPGRQRMEYLGTSLTGDVHDQAELVK